MIDTVVYELSDKWDEIYDELCAEYFDFEKFKEICVDTINLFFNLRNDQKLDKEYVYLLLSVNKFSVEPTVSDKKCEACKIIAQSICDQAVSAWISADGNDPTSDTFVVLYDDEPFVLDLNTFDISDLINNM